MSLKAGRVGVNPADVDPIDGHISPSSVDSYTKAQADDKFQPKTLEVPIKYLNGSVLGTFNTVQEALSGSYGPDGAMTNEELSASEIPSFTVDGTVITSIRNNNSIVLKGHKIAIINITVIVGTYANWTTCVSGLPKVKDINVSVLAFNLDNARIFSGLIDPSGNLKLVALTDTTPLTGHAINISACYPYSSL